MEDEIVEYNPENYETSLVPVQAMPTLQQGNIDEGFVDRYEMIVRSKFNSSLIKWHVGKGNKVFHYIPHEIMTQVLNTFLGELWSWEVQNVEFVPWKEFMAPVVVGKLTIFIPMKDGTYFTKVITETGAFDGNASMSPSALAGSCASRTLMKCCFRMFNTGMHFYGNNDMITGSEAWGKLKQYAKVALKISDEQEVASILKEHGLTGANLPKNFKACLAVLVSYFNKNLIDTMEIPIFSEDEPSLNQMIKEELEYLETESLNERIQEPVYEDITEDEAIDILNKTETPTSLEL